MEEIFFRGKDKETNEWVYGCGYCDEGFIGKIVTYFDSYTDEEGTTEHFYDFIRVVPETVGEFSGLRDKHRNKIFEGDIVKTKHGRLCVVVRFCSDCFNGFDLKPIKTRENLDKGMPDKFDLWYSKNLEIVGNIYDNKDLFILGGSI